MGWSSGTDVMKDIILGIKKKFLNEKDRIKIYDVVYEALTNADWDCTNECLDLDSAYDKMWKKKNPDYYDEDE